MIETNEATRMNEVSSEGGDMMTNEDDVYRNSPIISPMMHNLKEGVVYRGDAIETHTITTYNPTSAITALVNAVELIDDRVRDVETSINTVMDDAKESNDETFESRLVALEDNIKVIDERLNGLIEVLLGVQDL
jgi:hypothetical protein